MLGIYFNEAMTAIFIVQDGVEVESMGSEMPAVYCNNWEKLHYIIMWALSHKREKAHVMAFHEGKVFPIGKARKPLCTTV